MELVSSITYQVSSILKELGLQDEIEVSLTIPQDLSHGDYTTNVAMKIFGSINREASSAKFNSPLSLAEEISSRFPLSDSRFLEKVEAVKPGFINFTLSKEYLINEMNDMIQHPDVVGRTEKLKDKKIMVEFAHPNTHKEMHIGHMRTLITGESVSRTLEANGAEVFRANYQGDIGPHVAKAIIGIQEILKEEKIKFEEIQKWSHKDKAHFLGRGYVKGNKLYLNKKYKSEIDEINSFLYKRLLASEKEIKEGTISSFRLEEQNKIWNLYQETRKWSLDYYEDFYKRFYTKFKKLFFETEMVGSGKKIVESNIGRVFSKDGDGSVILSKEKSGLHTRVFITQAGNPTYEGKEMGNAFKEYEAFQFDRKIHVVGSEQVGYFQVVFKALELLDPEKFEGKQYHLPMGMVQLAQGKISSRTGEILRVDWLIDEVKQATESLFKEGKLSTNMKEIVLEQIAIGAIKYSVLKVGAKQDVSFDIQTSVTLDGNSGPYIQYTYVRTQSILEKAKLASSDSFLHPLRFTLYPFHPEELTLLRMAHQFNEVVQKAGDELAPNAIAEYLYEVSKQFNLFYQTLRIIDAETPQQVTFRLALTQLTGLILKRGLELLGIVAPERM